MGIEGNEVKKVNIRKDQKIDNFFIVLFKSVILLSVIFIGLYFFDSRLSLENIKVGEHLPAINNMLAIMAAASCGIYYYTYKKKSLLLILFIYTSLATENILGSILTASGNQLYTLNQFNLVFGHIFRVILLTLALVEHSKVLKWIADRGVKSIVWIIMITIGLLFSELLLYDNIGGSFCKNTLIVINCILVIQIFLMVFALKEKSLREKKGIYIIIASSISMFALKRLYSISTIETYRNDYSNLVMVFIFLAYLIVVIGLFIETIKSINSGQELREELQLFYNITHHNKINAVLIFDENDNIIYTNELFEEKYREEFNAVFKDGDQLVKGKNQLISQDVADKLISIVNSEGKFNGIVEQTNGKKIYHDIQRVLTDKNEIVTMVSFRDVTEEENMKLDYYKIKEQDVLRTEFFANLSHELKTPINIIYSTFQLLNERRQNSYEEFQNYYDKYKGTIKQNCFRILRLINNLIDMTRLEVGSVKSMIENVDIISLIENITLSIIPYVEAKKINIIFDTQVEEHIIKCDKEKIERVMLNLLSNAVKFTDIEGNILVDVEVEEEWIVVRVKDDGIGIPENMKDYVFERFAQTNKSLNREKEGSGIGLALVKSIIELHNGKVYLNNDNKVGCEIIFKLPNIRLEEEVDYKIIKEDDRPIKEKISLELSDIYDIN